MSEHKRDWFRDPPPRRIGALALITRADEFLIIERSYWQAVSRWGMPGGSAETDEVPRRALARSLAEKLNIRVTPEEFLAVEYAPVRMEGFEGFNFVYHVPLPPGTEPAPVEGSGYADARWVTQDTVGLLAVEHELLRIEQCLSLLHEGRTEDLLLGVPLHSSRALPLNRQDRTLHPGS